MPDAAVFARCAELFLNQALPKTRREVIRMQGIVDSQEVDGVTRFLHFLPPLYMPIYRDGRYGSSTSGSKDASGSSTSIGPASL